MHKESSFIRDIHLMLLVLSVALLLGVQFMTATAMASASTGGTYTIGSLNLEYGAKKTLKPMPLAAGEQPAMQGYRTKVKSMPTISELQMAAPTGDAAQDLLNNVVPSGTPWYSAEAGDVTFDDPIRAQNTWKKYRALQLSPDAEKRWGTIVNSFTCDYCCGSPQSPTIITQCGCAHSLAAQGMAKWFLSNYGDQYTDEEIYGEMARWYALWYPGPTIKRIILESQN